MGMDPADHPHLVPPASGSASSLPPPPLHPVAAAAAARASQSPYAKAAALPAKACVAPPSSSGSVPAALAPGSSSATRSDAPSVKVSTRGNTRKALEALRKHGLESLVNELVQDRTARSAVGDKESHWTKWNEFHTAAIPDIPVLLISPWS